MLSHRAQWLIAVLLRQLGEKHCATRSRIELPRDWPLKKTGISNSLWVDGFGKSAARRFERPLSYSGRESKLWRRLLDLSSESPFSLTVD